MTGLGAVTPLGHTVPQTWEALVHGKVGVRPITDVPFYFPNFIADDKTKSAEVKRNKFEQLIASIPCEVAAPVMPLASSSPSSSSAPFDPFAPTSREPRSIKFAMVATNEALAMSCGSSSGNHSSVGVPFPDALHTFYGPDRIGISVGMGMSGLQDVADASNALYSHESAVFYKQINPFFVPKILANMAAGMIAIKYKLQGGPISSAVTACATGAHNIGEAFEWVSNGLCDAAVCGATEACITPVSIGGFCRMNAMSVKFNNTPANASRPFDRDRCGFVMGEGAGILVIEELESALRRNAPILCELRGYGLSSDAHHVASPHPEGNGAAMCIRSALKCAGIEDPCVIGYANAHATGTPMGDEIELNALTGALRPTNEENEREGYFSSSLTSAPPLYISSIKGAMGHLLGAAGAVEAITTVLTVKHKIIPPNTNLDNPIAFDADRVVLPTLSSPRSSPRRVGGGGATEDVAAADDDNTTAAAKVGGEGSSGAADVIAMPNLRAAISTSFGFGGANAALLFTEL